MVSRDVVVASWEVASALPCGRWTSRRRRRVAKFTQLESVVTPSRLCEEVTQDVNITGSLRFGYGNAYDFAARFQPREQLSVRAWTTPGLSRSVRGLFA